MPTFTRNGQTVTTDKPVLIVQLRAEGWKQQMETAEPKRTPVKRASKTTPTKRRARRT